MRVPVLIVVLLGLLLVGVAVDADSASSPTTDSLSQSPFDAGQQDSTEQIRNGAITAASTHTDPLRSPRATNVSYTYRRLPAQGGAVEVTMRVSPRPDAGTVSVAFGDTFTVRESTNVSRNGSTFELDGTGTATFTYRLPTDWSYAGNSGESWTLVRHRAPSIRAGKTNATIRTAGEGYVGDKMILLGAHEVYARQAASQRIDIVVPEGVSLLYGPKRTADALANASRALRVGGRADVVHAMVTPEIETEATQLIQPGFSLGDGELLVDADSEFDVWTHEYVHTRQTFSDAEGLAWLVEGSAEYYGWLLSIQTGYDSWAPLRGSFSSGVGDDSTLSDPESWRPESDYNKGALVLAVIDRDIRAATDGQRTLQDALRRINSGNSTLESLIEAISDVADGDVAATARRYISTSATPEYQPTDEEFESVYGYTSPQVGTELIEVTAVGDGWTRALDPDGTLQIGASETVRVTVRVTNDGDSAGVAAIAPRLFARETELARFDGRWVGRIPPGRSAVRTATHQFDEPGTYGTDLGNANGIAVVPDRGTASVTAVNVTRTEGSGRNVTVEATVRNTGNRRTFVSKPVSVEGQRVSTVTLVVNSDANQTATRSVAVPEGEVTVAVGTVNATVSEIATDEGSLPPDVLVAVGGLGVSVLTLWLLFRRSS